MADDRNDEVQDTIAELMQTPVGRRWLLKAGFSAAATGLLLRGATAWGAAGSDEAAEDAIAAQATGLAPRTVHFVLGAVGGLRDLRVISHGEEIPLSRHDRVTRAALRLEGTLWRKIDRTRLSHFATISLPSERARLVSLYGTRRGRTVVLAQAFCVPERVTLALARLAFRLEGSYRSVVGSPERLGALGLDDALLTSAREIVHLERVIDTYQTAVTLSMFHPNVAIKNPTTSVQATKSLLGQTPEVSTLGTYIGTMQRKGKDFAVHVPAVDANGQPSQITVVGKDGTSESGTFSTIQLNKTDATFRNTARSAFTAGIRGVRDTDSLGLVLDKPLDEVQGNPGTWHQPEGIAITATPYVAGGVEADVDVRIQNTGYLHGTKIVAPGSYGGGQLPLKLYNNYVRWVWVYVQYLKADGTNLSLSNSPTWPDTHHAQSLGLLPQVFTILGVPVWDQNTIDVNLDFPAEATAARVLFCGLGNDLVDGGWRQYFPADAYPDGIAPQDEVLFAAITTGIVTIGVTTLALIADADAAASWNSIRKFFSPDGSTRELLNAYKAIVEGPQYLTKAEAFTTLVAAGASTYAEVGANGSTDNIWTTLGALGSIIPKLFFSPGAEPLLAQIAFDVVATDSVQDVFKAIPIFGEVLAVIEVAGDVATLAEAIAETATSPWVIANQVSLTYGVKVTVSKDHRSATWPVKARSWRIEATIDGAVALSPVTGTVDGGRQSDAIVLNLTAPFGGKSITWSFVVFDDDGNQCGTGVTQLANNDPGNPPAVVSFEITELPAVIDADTVFQRAETVIYSPGAGGYTWLSGVADTGTLANSPIQEITGVTIATRLGVAGVVWKQSDKYWLRGVTIVENGTTIPLGGATRQGYARPPFLLFDAFVDDADVANHVLLEPDDTEPGYHIRSLKVDPATGALSWDPGVSLGDFTLPVTAAALHSSGRVVACHSITGRLGHVLPVATPRAPLAAYVAGPGTQIGLLTSPTGVAITNPGIVIVLEAGAARLSAFDLNGNPVRYFTNSSLGPFRLPLSQSATYLDIAVDGSGQIYLLYHLGDGSQVANYRIDVYTATGQPLATRSAGNNIPRLAVDYWRSIFAANYTPLLDEGTGQPRIDPALGVAEPSISRLDPQG